MTDDIQGHHVEFEMHPLDSRNTRRLSELFSEQRGELTIDGREIQAVAGSVNAELSTDAPGLVFVTMTVVATSGKITHPGRPDLTWGDMPETGHQNDAGAHVYPDSELRRHLRDSHSYSYAQVGNTDTATLRDEHREIHRLDENR